MENPLTKELFAGLVPLQGTDKFCSVLIVVGSDIKSYDVHYIRGAGINSHVSIIAAPGTWHEYKYDIDLAIEVGGNARPKWIEDGLGQPTVMSEAIGSAIEFKCRELKNTNV